MTKQTQRRRMRVVCETSSENRPEKVNPVNI